MANVDCANQRIAVIGSGITGLSAAWLLQRSGASVTLFEKDEVCGGHALTDDSASYPVDLGFQVYNLTTYPHLVGLFEALGVETEPSDMSFALSMDGGALEWGSRGLSAVFAQRSNLLRPTFWRMLVDVIRFGRAAPEVLNPENTAKFASMTLGEYLHSNGYSDAFSQHYILPMCAAVWSMPSSKTMGFPVVSLVRFWANHHLLDVTQRPCWRVVKGKSRSYVQAITAELKDVRMGTGVKSVAPRNEGGKVAVTTEAGAVEEYDSIIMATHADVSLAILGDTCPQGMREVLAACPYAENDVYLHSDPALMPVRRGTWASWNFLGSMAPESCNAAVCVTYWLNLLQNLPADAPPLFVTLNPITPPAEGKVLRRLSLAHPLVSAASTAAQLRLPSVQGEGGIFLAGAWTGYGFHEDGLKSAVDVTGHLGAAVPWVPRSVSPKISLVDRAFMAVFDRFARAAITVGQLTIVLPNGEELRYGSADSTAPAISPGEEWRGRPQLKATVRMFNTAFFRKVITKHDTGMGEAYMDGDYEVDDLGGLLAVACANARSIEGKRGLMGLMNWAGDKLLLLAHRARPNTVAGSRRNIEEHYDAGNAMYKLFLDETLTYSAGIHNPGDSLKQAQLNKLDAIIQLAGISATDHVLEIGCGWGSMAIRAAQTTGCRVTGITVSKEQLAEATKRVTAAGLSDRVTLLFCDYRDTPGGGTYDKVVSCEMIEAVGHEHLLTYFAAINSALKPGGSAVIQVISEPDDRYEEYCASSDFIREHIFPGGHLPSMGAMVEAARPTALQVRDVRDIGPDYAITLRAWREAWEEKKDAILQLGYSERFWRKYRFYFAYCEGAFDAKYIHDYHILWVKDVAACAALAAQPLPGPMNAAENAASVHPITQALLAVYFFLAGMAVSQRRLLLLTPAATAVCRGLLWLAATLSNSCLPAYRQLDEAARAWWALDVVHLLYSGAASATVLLAARGSWLSVAAPPTGAAAVLPDALVCISAGFFAFHLWALVYYRLFFHSYMKILHLTVMLCLFGAAAHKGEHTNLLSVLLISELHSLLYVAAKLMDMMPGASPTQRKVLHHAELLALPTCRLLPTAAVTVAVALQPGAFSTGVRWVIALSGLAYMNAVNGWKCYQSYQAYINGVVHTPARKAHTA